MHEAEQGPESGQPPMPPEPAVPSAPIPPPASFAGEMPFPPAAPGLDLQSRPHVFEAGRWVSADHRYWWNGAAWVFGPPPATPPTSTSAGAVIGVLVAVGGLIVFGIIALSMCQPMPGPPTLAP